MLAFWLNGPGARSWLLGRQGWLLGRSLPAGLPWVVAFAFWGGGCLGPSACSVPQRHPLLQPQAPGPTGLPFCFGVLHTQKSSVDSAQGLRYLPVLKLYKKEKIERVTVSDPSRACVDACTEGSP